MEILVEIKTVYGRELIYPLCDKALLLAELAGKKTLDRTDLAIIQRLGFQVNVKPIILKV